MKNVMVLVLVALGVAWGQELVATESYYPHGEVGLRIACPAEGAEWWSTVSTLDGGGAYLTLTCEATALTYHPGFSPEWMAYIVGGLQSDPAASDGEPGRCDRPHGLGWHVGR